jgi:hypothetical protein
MCEIFGLKVSRYDTEVCRVQRARSRAQSEGEVTQDKLPSDMVDPSRSFPERTFKNELTLQGKIGEDIECPEPKR